MLVLFLGGLFMLPLTYCWFDFVNIIVPMNHRKIYVWGSTIFIMVLWFLTSILSPGPSTAISLIMFIITELTVYYFAPAGRKGQAVLVHILLFAVQLVCVVITCFAPMFLPGFPVLTTKADPSYPICVLFCTVISCPSMYAAARLLRKILPPLQERKSLLVLLLFPFSHIIIVMFCLHLLYYGTSFADSGFTVMTVFLICVAQCILITLGYKYIHNMELMQLRAQETQQHLEVQVNYYNELQDKILEINQVRHDLANQLQAAYCMMQSDNHTEIAQQLDQLQDQIHNKIGTSYCTNMVVDAVLTNKSRRCRELGIPLQVSVFLPADLAVETAHLCSIFSNLLDNSITATVKTAAPYAPIDLYADLHGAYLTIRCSNASDGTVSPISKNPMRDHGLGLQILSRIAGLYNGHFETSYVDGTFTATMFLNVSQK